MRAPIAPVAITDMTLRIRESAKSKESQTGVLFYHPCHCVAKRYVFTINLEMFRTVVEQYYGRFAEWLLCVGFTGPAPCLRRKARVAAREQIWNLVELRLDPCFVCASCGIINNVVAGYERWLKRLAVKR